jgi:hypothetical protein
MATTIQRVDKDTFKQIFRDHWGPFQQRYPRYQDRDVQAVIDKMLGCGTPESGYTTYLCPHCLEERRVAFSCKSSSLNLSQFVAGQRHHTIRQPHCLKRCP